MRCVPKGRETLGDSPEKGGHFARAVAAEVSKDIERLTGTPVDGLDFEVLEREVRKTAISTAASLVAARLNADLSDGEAAELPCACGADARNVGRRPRTFTTALGPLTLERAWYHCSSCGHGFSPRDRTLALDGTSLSPAVTRMVGVTAAELSFEKSSTLLRELADLKVIPKQVERHAEALGGAIARDERDIIEPEPPGAPTLYLGLDGTGIPVRKSETEGRAGKQPDGSARTREVKLATIWSAESRDTEGRPVRDAGSVTFNAAIESIATRDTDTEPAPFAKRVLREMERRDFFAVDRRVVLGDGALWIWNFAAEHVPDAIQIVDIFHAKQHVFDVAKALYGKGSDLAAQWGKARRDELDQGRLDLVLAALRKHASHCDVAARNIEYFQNNRARMDYPRFREQGLCVSTGVVEGGCKSLIGGRLKRGGMHWSVSGANSIIALRCSVQSNRFDDYWERRAG